MTDLKFTGLRRTACTRACIITAYLRDEEGKENIGMFFMNHRMQPIVLRDEGKRTTIFFFHFPLSDQRKNFIHRLLERHKQAILEAG